MDYRNLPKIHVTGERVNGEKVLMEIVEILFWKNTTHIHEHREAIKRFFGHFSASPENKHSRASNIVARVLVRAVP